MSRPAVSWFAIALTNASLVVSLSGCRASSATTEASHAEKPVEAQPAQPMAEAPAAPAEAVTMVEDRTVTERWFPTGDAATSVVLLRQTVPSEIRLDRENEGLLEVVNLTGSPLPGVSVIAVASTNLEMLGSTPQPMPNQGGPTVWMLGDLPAKGSSSIAMRMKPLAEGPVSTVYAVNYASLLSASGTAVKPVLELAKTASPVVCGTCVDVVLNYTVRNSGTGTARSVLVKDRLPSGIQTLDGATEVALDAGDLTGGAERTFEVRARAVEIGTFASAASAADRTGLVANSESTETIVKEPSLEVTTEQKKRVFVGRDVTYRFQIFNPCDCDIPGAVVRAAIPAGTTLLSSTPEGTVEGDAVVWNVGAVPAGKSMEFRLKLRPTGDTVAPFKATVAAACIADASGETAAEMATVANTTFSVRDSDPVEIGSETTFTVEVTNDGSGADRAVAIVADLPASLEFVSGTGPTAVTAEGSRITIVPLAELAAGGKAQWTIVVKATAVEDARSRWELSCERLKTPVVRTESTNIYE